jgi:hypothetical protein
VSGQIYLKAGCVVGEEQFYVFISRKHVSTEMFCEKEVDDGM